MKDKTKLKDKWLHLRLTNEEYKLLIERFSKTTESKFSRYARKILLTKAVTVNHRNQSLDEIVTVLTRIQNDLNGVANNYNQMVHKLHTLDQVPEINAWLRSYEKEKKTLHENIGEVKYFIAQTAEKWLR